MLWAPVLASLEIPAKRMQVVLIAGDEEYRSELMLPQLAKILEKRHGFKCKVLYSIALDGTIDPTVTTNIPGLDALEHTDLVVMLVRFRNLPDFQMKYFADYVKAGKPVIGIRTSTHAFQMDPASSFAEYDWRSKAWPGGFGRQILGETWIAHHGNHMVQSTRAMPGLAMANSPLLNGIESVWVPTDVYRVGPLPTDCNVLLNGLVLSGMNPSDSPVAGSQNDPPLPVAWTRTLGTGQRVFTTTMGSGRDFLSPDFRRLLVNACYWCTGRKVPAKASIDLVGEYDPGEIGFGKHHKGVKPPKE